MVFPRERAYDRSASKLTLTKTDISAGVISSNSMSSFAKEERAGASFRCNLPASVVGVARICGETVNEEATYSYIRDIVLVDFASASPTKLNYYGIL